MKVLINGAQGRMGQMAQAALSANPAFEIVAKTGRLDDLASEIEKSGAEIVLDLTNADVVYQNTLTIIKAGAHPVIGSTGLTTEQILELQALCEKQKLGGIIAPNFSIGAVLMMQFAQKTAAYFQYAEIIEAHHENKKDAPSGTAMKTAEQIAKIRHNTPLPVETTEIVSGVRGATVDSIPIHSIRLPGILAAQEVIFGGAGETFKLSHSTINRDCYCEGLILACKAVKNLSSLVYGLESILLPYHTLNL
jgi:4-hydroxy-tetrahydrodipicolinate reductase